MAKTLIRFGIAGEKRASQLLPIKKAAELAHDLDTVFGSRGRPDYVPGTIEHFTVSRRVTAAGAENPNGFYVRVEYCPHA